MIYTPPVLDNPILLLPRHKNRRGPLPRNPSPRNLKAKRQRNEIGFVPTEPPGVVQRQCEVPAIPLISKTAPSPAIGREMLYELVQFFGTIEAARMLGFELGNVLLDDILLGTDAYYDACYAKTNLRSIWFLWSLTFCPGNLRDSFHLQTWGYYNTEYVGAIADKHRAIVARRLKAMPKRTPKKTRSQKILSTKERRRKKLPSGFQYVHTRNPAKLKRRAELMQEIIASEKRERKKAKLTGRAARKALQAIYSQAATHSKRNKVAPEVPPQLRGR